MPASSRHAADFIWFWVASLLASVSAATATLALETIDADLLLIGGTVYAGDGQPGQRGDVAVRGDRVVAVGDFSIGEVGQTID